MSRDKFRDIRPYYGEEESKALARIAGHPVLDRIADFLFPGENPDRFRNLISELDSVSDFQSEVMLHAIKKIIEKTAEELNYSGHEQLRSDKRYLFISNHRDIMLDSAIIQVILFMNNLDTSEMAVGDNLITDEFIEDVARSNKMIKVIRKGNPRELYKASLLLSEYIRDRVSSGKSSVWIAQRNGRTKDGVDLTEQGLLKMFDMSGKGYFVKDFEELNITPVSISYEYEPCDFLKAREIYISRRQKYVKEPGEDLNSILTGILQYKGNIHIHFCETINSTELYRSGEMEKNEKFKSLAEIIDKKIHESYHLWKTNLMAYDISNSSDRYNEHYTAEELTNFNYYLEKKCDGFDGDRSELKNILLSIYANPVVHSLKE
jgi:hypothetical protein